ncbi:MAG: trypsin-like peptidase domain-containing protein [Candidatus Melainabacteria bacterium]|nr:trypsin-like peptidase domain-containing protein [Candidatus Melainabacteria bacterium]
MMTSPGIAAWGERLQSLPNPALAPDANLPPTARTDADEAENVQVYEHAAKAVVTINAFVDGHPASGAGVIVDPRGLVITSRHVVGMAPQVSVSLENGQKLRGTVVGRIEDNMDLAIIRLNTNQSLPSLPFGNSDHIRVGHKVLAIGNPYGFERTLTLGIVSRIDRQRNRIQTDAAINPGNSGGPLLNRQGEVIGISQSIFNPDGNRSNIGIGFAVPANTIQHYLQQWAKQPTLPHVAKQQHLPGPFYATSQQTLRPVSLAPNLTSTNRTVQQAQPTSH